MPSGWTRATIAAMENGHVPAEHALVVLTVAAGELRGWFHPAHGEARPFAGQLELLASVQELLAGPDDHGRRTTS